MLTELLLLLFFVHALADYPLQGDFLARGKNHLAPLPGVPWWHCLIAHGAIHGGLTGIAVYAVTGDSDLAMAIGVAETAIHSVVDHTKCNGEIDIHTDQAIHLLCKVGWVWLVSAFA